MNEKVKSVLKAAGAGTLALMFAMPSFAQSRDERRRGDSDSNRSRTQSSRRDDRSSNRAYRENERVTAEGKIRSFSRERDGYRVHLDQGRHSYWVPQSHFRNQRPISVGLAIRLGGIFRNGAIYVDAVNWPGDRGYADRYGYNDRYDSRYDSGYVRGTVDRVDERRGTLWLRDDRGGDLIAVEMRNSRYDRNDLRDLRRGDYVEISGQWLRGGLFEAYRIEDVRGRRY